MSPVVQQLENMAVKDPAYQNGQTRNSRTTSNVGGVSSTVATIPQATEQGTPKATDSTSFQPLAYNPAAPAAPEPIKHREKTPPPIDADEGTGIALAAYREHHSIYSQGSVSRPTYGSVHQSQGFVSPQPAQTQTPSFMMHPQSGGHSNPASAAQSHRASSVSSFPPPPPSQGGPSSHSPYTPTPAFAHPPQQSPGSTPHNSQQLVPAFSAPPPERPPFYSKDSAPAESPATEILGSSYVSGVRQPLQHLQPQYANFTPSPSNSQDPEPVGGYSDYSYKQEQSHHSQQPQSSGNEYDVHSQVYRPTPEEVKKKKPSKASTAAPDSSTGRLEQGAGKVDKKVNSFFKKLEKKIG